MTYILEGQEKTFSVLYVRYFEEILQEITPFEGNPVFQIEEQDIYLRDIVALVCFIKNEEFRGQKRMYINIIEDFQKYFDTETVGRVQDIIVELHKNKEVEIV